MKGQFFIIASVIIVFSLAGLITYVYDFGSVDLTRVEEISGLNYIEHVKKSLNETVHASYSSEDCVKLELDLNSTIDYLEEQLSKKGIILKINYMYSCPPPDYDFIFSIKTADLYSETNFRVTV